jgi:hypothetical protein
MLESQPPNPNTHYFDEDTRVAQGCAEPNPESIQGTRSRPRLVPEKLRNKRLWVVAAPPKDRLIRV